MDKQGSTSTLDDVDAHASHSEVDPRFARDAARVNLRIMLDQKTHGDRITAAEIITATGFDKWNSFRGPIKTWAKRNNYVLQAVPNDGYRVADAAGIIDTSKQLGRQQFALAEERDRVIGTVPIDRLKENEVPVYTQERMRSTRALEVARRNESETRKQEQIGAAPRVPMKLVGKTPQ